MLFEKRKMGLEGGEQGIKRMVGRFKLPSDAGKIHVPTMIATAIVSACIMLPIGGVIGNYYFSAKQKAEKVAMAGKGTGSLGSFLLQLDSLNQMLKDALVMKNHVPTKKELESNLFSDIIDGSYANVEQKLAAGADVNARCEECGMATPLIWAASEGRAKICKLLIKKGADVNAKDKDGETALHSAVMADSGYMEICTLLLKNHADINARDKEDYTALYYVNGSGKAELVAYLKSKGATE